MGLRIKSENLDQNQIKKFAKIFMSDAVNKSAKNDTIQQSFRQFFQNVFSSISKVALEYKIF